MWYSVLYMVGVRTAAQRRVAIADLDGFGVGAIGRGCPAELYSMTSMIGLGHVPTRSDWGRPMGGGNVQTGILGVSLF